MGLRLTWDVFCHVVDNFGDIGVCWRLCRQLSQQGHTVRLWADDASALAWMAPDRGTVQVLDWAAAQNREAVHGAWEQADINVMHPADVVVEAFGCDLPTAFIATLAARKPPPVWINLEYLSAEPYVERSHGLPSPQQCGPAAGLLKWFFYPGFTAGTGGLLRERDLTQRRAAFDRRAWREALGINTQDSVVMLFAYRDAPVQGLLDGLAPAWAQAHQRMHLLVAAGSLQERLLAQAGLNRGAPDKAATPLPPGVPLAEGRGVLHPLPWLPQSAFDEALWAADLNVVRGEDSLVRALWAGVPFIWDIYPQHDGAHKAKLQALLQALLSAASAADRALIAAPLSRLWQAWVDRNEDLAGALTVLLDPPCWLAWQRCVRALGEQLLAQGDLATRLQAFVASKL